MKHEYSRPENITVKVNKVYDVTNEIVTSGFLPFHPSKTANKVTIAESLYAVRCVLPPATTVNCIRASTHRTDTLFVCNAYAF